ncbi:hypothetical protein [uncultured Parasphingorhabdus sp.]|uniref:hypothetical protein n=1 Tax=uncultured Parasphingorhabdus sp. TaxID=2709694 RepID=UPI0037488BAC
MIAMSETGRKFGRADHVLTATLLTILFGTALLLFYSDLWGLSDAGLVALLVIPAALGGLTVQFADPNGSKSMLGCIGFVTLGLGIIFLLTYLANIEGLICIAMLFPLWIPAAAVGALVNRWNAGEARKQGRTRLMSAGWVIVPLALLAAEQRIPPEWNSWEVSREIEIEAPAKTVWPLLINIPAISSDEGTFNLTQDILMVPRPSEAKIQRESDGLIRKAQWGENIRFKEVVTGFEKGTMLSWNFRFPDDSVQQYTDRHISPDGDKLKIISGRYEIKQMGNNRSKLALTTRYKMRSHMDLYLGLWGDLLLGDVQANILHIIKMRAENSSGEHRVAGDRISSLYTSTDLLLALGTP